MLRTHRHFIALFVIAMLIRLVLLPSNAQLDYGDGPTDYLVVSHILQFGEHPVFGLMSAVLGHLPTSPLYYYLLVPFVAVFHSMMGLGVAAVVINAVTIIMVYALAYLLFGKKTATIASALFIFSQNFFQQSFYFWRPWLGQMFFLTSYVFLARAYIKNQYVALIVSTLCFLLGMSTGSHGFGALSGFLVVTMLVAGSFRLTSVKLFVHIALSGVLGYVIYQPIIAYLQDANNTALLAKETVFVSSLGQYFTRVIENIMILFGGIIQFDRLPGIFAHGAWIVLLGAMYLYVKRNWSTKFGIRWLTMVGYVLSVLATAAFLPSSKYYYFNSVIGLVVILLSELIGRVWPKKFTRVGIVLSVFVLLCFMLPGWGYITQVKGNQSVEHSLASGVAAIESEIDLMRDEFGQQWPEHLQMVNYDFIRSRKDTGALEAYWVGLEQATDTRLVGLVPLEKSYEPLATYVSRVVIVCTSYPDELTAKELCTERFLQEYPGYFIARTIYLDTQRSVYFIFLGRRSI